MTDLTLPPTIDRDLLRQRLAKLGLWGLLRAIDESPPQPWLDEVIDVEEKERRRRSLERRLRSSRIGAFKPIGDFDWAWPSKADRATFDELMTLQFIPDGANAVLLGPNGVGKTTLAQNLAHEAVLHGHTVLFTTASDMLSDLAAQESGAALARRVRRYARVALLVIDEVGYLSYDARYADLLFEVVSRRYKDKRAIVLTTNKAFNEWPEVFPNAACVVTLVDRLVHRAEVIQIEGSSYRLREAKDRAAAKAKRRARK